MKKFLLYFSLLTLNFSLAFAQSTQFYLEDSVGPGLTARIYLVGQTAAKAQVQEALYAAIDHAREAAGKIKGEIADINQKKTKGEILVSQASAKVIQTGLELSKQTDGRFDITGGNFKKIKVSLKNNAVNVRGENIEINVDLILKGFLADTLADDLVKAGWTNCLVKIDAVYVTRGSDVEKPWSIPVVVPSEKIAKRVLYYKTKMDQAAGATWSPADTTSSNLKSVTIFSKSGGEAEGLANAVYQMGLEEGKKFLSANKSLSAIFVDNQGNLTNVP